MSATIRAGTLVGPEEMTGDQMVAAMDAVGVDGAVLVSFSMYRPSVIEYLSQGIIVPCCRAREKLTKGIPQYSQGS
jgi:hypothetical protein